MPIELYGYVAAWDLPDISPYVTKVVNYMTFTGIPFEYKNQDLTTLDNDTPYGKLPMINDGGTKVADSSLIVEYLKKTHGDKLDRDMTKTEKATALAFQRLIEENLYWAGVIESRWQQDRGFETYIPYLVQGAEVTPPLRQFLDAFRARIQAGSTGQGMGKRPTEVALEFYKADVDALSDFMGDNKYFMGDKLRSVDATVYSIVRHLLDQPQKWEGTPYIEGKKNLVDYAARIRAEYKV